jgi:hypothetical protein
MIYTRSAKSKKSTQSHSKMEWIEKLLVTPISDYRKNAIGLIIAPYLINIRKIDFAEAQKIIEKWLNICNSVRNLGPDFRHRIKWDILYAHKRQIPPMKLETLKLKNKELYEMLHK